MNPSNAKQHTPIIKQFILLSIIILFSVACSSQANKSDKNSANSNGGYNLLFDSIINKKDATNNEYTNNNIGFSFVFPNNFYIKETEDNNKKNIYLTPLKNGDQKTKTEASIMLSLNFAVKENNEDIISEYSQNKESFPGLSIKDSSISGIPIKNIQYRDTYSGSIISAIIIKTKENTLEISYFNDSKESPIYQAIINNLKIL